MTDLVTLEEVRAHLRIDDYDSNGGPDDTWLNIFITSVSSAVLLWLKDEWRAYETEFDSDGDILLDSNDDPVPVLDSSGERVLQPVVRAAVLIEIDRQYRFRGGEGDADVPPDAGYGYVLGKGATALLTALRKSTVG